ncbi:MAG TPA: TROVE domain-containing protein [Glycomyces sp.]|nr:TROVE domain-containing protein [Glycomyces sp.]
MAKFNRPGTRAATTSPVRTEPSPSGWTFEGALGFGRDVKSELYLLAVTNMVGEQTFYESSVGRDSRYAQLIGEIALADPEWIARFLTWLRNGAHMRSASLVGGLEAARAMVAAGIPGGRRIVDAVLQRPDEPGESLAYWAAAHGRTMPKAVKRGISDAATRLYSERSALKYDTASKGYRFGDVLNLVHATPREDWQADLFGHLLDRRYGRDEAIPDSLAMLRANRALRDEAAVRPEVLLDPDRLSKAGMTWEDALSLAGTSVDKAKLWEAMIPSMGYMACLAEGTPVWLPDGTTAPIEAVVAQRLQVLSYDKSWDTRAVEYGANQGIRDDPVGKLIPITPTAWIDAGLRPVASIRFTSGRVIEATYDHRWVRQRQSGPKAWEWTTTGDLKIDDRIPTPLTASYFGDEGDARDGYFVGAMLGDGGMTALTPEFHADPHDGAAAFMRDYAVEHGCEVREDKRGTIVRMRFPYRQWRRNPVTEVLRHYDVRGKRCERKALPQRPFSRDFWIGTLSGLIDADGCVRERRNPKSAYHASVEYATVSLRLAEQVSDALLRLGVASVVRERPVRGIANHPIHLVEVSRAIAVVRLAGLLDLRIGYKAAKLERAAEKLAHVEPARSEMNGYDGSVALDRIAAIEDAGVKPAYCVTVEPSNLFVANGIATGNCLRNLRNFDAAGVSDAVAAEVAARLADPDEVARSRQMPMRFLSAHKAAPSLRWRHALDKALAASLGSVPELDGRTLILVDTSASMNSGFSRDGTLKRWDAAAMFGLALARRCKESDVVSFSSDWNGRQPTMVFPAVAGESLLRSLDRWQHGGYFIGGGTETEAAVRAHYAGHDTVVILTDEQARHGFSNDVAAAVPTSKAVYTWNLAGYRFGHAPSGSGGRHTFGGLSDAAFGMIGLLEQGRNADWPF